MTRTARHLASEAERRLPVRVRVAVLPGGFGNRLTAMHAWLDDNCGLDGWAEAPAASAASSTMQWRFISAIPGSPSPS